ncbi:MAG: hypothetical protein JWR10_857 [Rubritepida sp.]|nr:hypothetical protein [Rubritepida sp.]
MSAARPRARCCDMGTGQTNHLAMGFGLYENS